MRVPRVLDGRNLPKGEKEKIARIVRPKPGSGNLEVPENIFEMWNDVAKGRQQLFSMWAKSGGVKANEDGNQLITPLNASCLEIFFPQSTIVGKLYTSVFPYKYPSITPVPFQAVFMESITIHSQSTRSKKLEVKGGFYSKEDMKKDLGYSECHSQLSILREICPS